MKASVWLLALLVAVVAAGITGCGSGPPESPGNKPLTEQEKKQVDDDMRKAIQVNKKAK